MFVAYFRRRSYQNRSRIQGREDLEPDLRMRRPKDPECIEVSKERNALARQVLTHIEPMFCIIKTSNNWIFIYVLHCYFQYFKMQSSYVRIPDIATPCQTNPPTIFN